jgi:hypothetical protein
MIIWSFYCIDLCVNAAISNIILLIRGLYHDTIGRFLVHCYKAYGTEYSNMICYTLEP